MSLMKKDSLDRITREFWLFKSDRDKDAMCRIYVNTFFKAQNLKGNNDGCYTWSVNPSS